MITNNDNRGFTLVEVMVVVAIMGVIAGLIVYQMAGQKAKSNSEASVKQMYSDLSEMRADAMSQKNAFGVFLTGSATANFSFSSYALRSDNNSDGSITDTGGFGTVRTTTLSQLAPLTVLNAITDITYDSKGFLSTANQIEIYAPCPGCDAGSVSNCSGAYENTACTSAAATSCCRMADMSTNCSDASYPESSCLVLTVNFIKMGKWCDANQNGVYDSGECVLK
ncbi:pilus assembly FimT family protein [Candidatus Magnetominusculus dajiuhuensis]|uniref:pilus assembly FimT family protein n=1 Tax=Candidatus Magnetominusculus dajiuhuensis TaxID=3137712 RepID=UPI0019E13184|nr:type II secretion system protein [Nitrospirota bacterium]